MLTTPVSILMPVYNAAATLVSAVRSVLWQTYQHWELVIADDGSTDGSLELALGLARKDRRIRVLSLEHQGIVAALQQGLQGCTHELVARMDADDLSHPQRLAKQVAYLEEHPEVAVLGSLVRIFPKVGLTLGMRRYERWLNEATDSRRLERDIFVESPLVHPSTMFRKTVVQEVGGYIQSPWPEDYYLWLRLWLKGKILSKIPEVLFYWRDVPTRVTRTDVRCGHDSLRSLKITMFLRAYFSEQGSSSLRLRNPEPQEPVLLATAPTKVGGAQASTGARRLIIWGAGPNGKALAKGFQALGLYPAAFVDIRSARRGQHICGMPVLGIDQLPSPGDFFLVTAVGSPAAREEIRAHLDGQGWQEGRDYRCMAGISD